MKRPLNILDHLAAKEVTCGNVLNVVWPGQSCSPSGVICKDTASTNCLSSPFLQSLEFDFY